jgi:hypothetical protein
LTRMNAMRSFLGLGSFAFIFDSMRLLRIQLYPILPEETCISSTKNQS